MSLFGEIMAGYCVAAILLILWLLAIEAHEAVRKRRMTPRERELDEYVADVERRYREAQGEAARQADAAARQRARERYGL